MPAIGGYWFRPLAIASVTDCTSRGSQSKSGKPWPRFTAPFSVASADITVKMVVPTAGSFVWSAGVRASRVSELIVVGVPAHRLGDQVAIEAVGKQFGELEDEIAKVGPALERDACDVLPEQGAERPRDQVALVLALHRH